MWQMERLSEPQCCSTPQSPPTLCDPVDYTQYRSMGLQSFGQLMRRTDTLEKTLMPGKTEGGRRRDEMVGRHHRLDGLEFE